MAEPPPRRRVRDAELMRALAHPLRSAILNHLMAVGPRTASECAAAVNSSASNCSWHLRQLERYGLVENAEPSAPSADVDGRQRPWRATQVGLDFGGLDDDPNLRSAQLALAGARLNEDQSLTQRFLDTADSLPAKWQDAAAMNAYALRVTAEELADLVEAVDQLIRPYVATIRTDPPEAARPVHVGLRAFLRLEADGQARP